MNAGFGFAASAATLRDVQSMQFSVMDPSEIRRMSVCEITKPYSRGPAGELIAGGLLDERMGSCPSKDSEHPGYFGHIQLEEPVWHAGFLPAVYMILQCVCFKCGNLLCDTNSEQVRDIVKAYQGKQRLRHIYKLCRGQRCTGNESLQGEDGQPPREPAPLYTYNELAEKFGHLPEAELRAKQVLCEEPFGTGQRSGCDCAAPKFSRNGFRVIMKFSTGDGKDQAVGDRVDSNREVTPAEAANLLGQLSAENVRILGLDPVFSHPKWLVWTVIPVAPPHVRPSVLGSDDDLTFMYSNIVKSNIALRSAKMKEAPASQQAAMREALQFHCAVFMDNTMPGQDTAKQRSGKPLKSIRERLVGKAGRVRGNLMGKRVNFSARSVITADPILSIDQVGVPKSVANTLTIPERVSRHNLARLTALIKAGPDKHPGARYIQRADGAVVDLAQASSTSDRMLQEGFIVERYLEDGDYVLFNRQPTLHKMSIMCHRAKVLDYSTFRLNLTCTTPYNADFDGDEMNMHAIQTLPAIVEARELMITPRLIVSAQSNRPVMGIVQDTLLGAQKMSKRDVFLAKDMVYNTVMWMDDTASSRLPVPAILLPRKTADGQRTSPQVFWTGKQMLSMIMPDMNYKRRSRSGGKGGDPEREVWAKDNQVVVEKGVMLAGILDKNSLGTSQDSIIHVMCNDVTAESARDFINMLQRVVNYWLQNRGFTVGLGDTEAPIHTMKAVDEVLVKARKDLKDLVAAARAGTVTVQPGKTMDQTFESLVFSALNKARSSASACVQKAVDENNNIIAMATAGSKGNEDNIAQIIACLGQQGVSGKRVPRAFRDRTLPHFSKFDIGAEAGGFVQNSYLKGLTPVEFFFHMMSGREGLIDTAVKTADTGYVQHKLIKVMEDLVVQYDGTVRNSVGEVVQFLYGEDGLDGRWIEEESFPSVGTGGSRAVSAQHLSNMFEWNILSPQFLRAAAEWVEPSVLPKLDSAAHNRLQQEFQTIRADREVIVGALRKAGRESSGKLYMPFAMQRAIANAQHKFGIDRQQGRSDLDPCEVADRVDEYVQSRFIVVPGSDPISVEAQRNAIALLSALVRCHLASKRVIQHHRLTRKAFEYVLGELGRRFQLALVAGGESCGILAAQSIGEPTTQMTLNTFHSAGVAEKNVTLGLPRLRELIDVAARLRTPAMTVFLRSDIKTRSAEEVLKLCRPKLEFVDIQRLVAATSIVFDPDPTTSVLEEDAEWVAAAAMAQGDAVASGSVRPWVLRFEFNFAAITGADILMEELEQAICQYDVTLNVLRSSENAERPVLRVRMTEGTLQRASEGDTSLLKKFDNEVKVLRVVEREILNIQLRGIKQVSKVHKSDKKDDFVWSAEGGLLAVDAYRVLQTDGTSLRQTLALLEVDATRTVSNHMEEVREVLGIEACRAALFNELRNVISFDNAYVNYRHLALLVDWMCFSGRMAPVSREGVSRQAVGPIQRASFERTVEIFMDAAVYAEPDGLAGVSQSVLLGQQPLVGTGVFDLILDNDQLTHAVISGQGEVQSGTGADSDVGQTQYHKSPDAVSVGNLSAAGQLTGVAFTPGSVMSRHEASMRSVRGFDYGASAQSSDYGAMSARFGLEGSGGMSAGLHGESTPTSPSMGYSPTSPLAGSQAGHGTSPTSPSCSPAYSPSSPAMAGGHVYSPSSPAMGNMSATSPEYSPSSPAMGGAAYSPTSPAFGGGVGGASPAYSPTSPAFGGASGASGASPAYSPTSPAFGGASGASGASPAYSPTSPAFGGASGASGASPAYSPTSPAFAGAAAGASAASPAYSPTSPAFGGAAAGASAASPAYSPTSPAFGGAAAGTSAASPAYSPTSPSLGQNGTSGASSASPTYSP